MIILNEALNPTATQLPSKYSLTGLRSFATCGPGGVGKSRVAAGFVSSQKSHFGAIFWLAADKPAKLAIGFADIAARLGLENPEECGDHVVSRDLVLEWLSAPSKGPKGNSDEQPLLKRDTSWHLIFDNVDDPDTLNDYWPVTGNGSVLVTSRDPLAKSNIYMRHGMDLEPFSVTEGAAWLRDLTGCKSSRDIMASEKVIGRLGGFPLAITLIGGSILRRTLSFDKFLDLYNTNPFMLAFHQDNVGTKQDKYDQTLFSVWALDDLAQ